MCLNFLYNCICNDRYFIIDALSWCIPAYLFLLSFIYIQLNFVFGVSILAISLILLSIKAYITYYYDDNE